MVALRKTKQQHLPGARLRPDRALLVINYFSICGLPSQYAVEVKSFRFKLLAQAAHGANHRVLFQWYVHDEMLFNAVLKEHLLPCCWLTFLIREESRELSEAREDAQETLVDGKSTFQCRQWEKTYWRWENCTKHRRMWKMTALAWNGWWLDGWDMWFKIPRSTQDELWWLLIEYCDHYIFFQYYDDYCCIYANRPVSSRERRYSKVFRLQPEFGFTDFRSARNASHLPHWIISKKKLLSFPFLGQPFQTYTLNPSISLNPSMSHPVRLHPHCSI